MRNRKPPQNPGENITRIHKVEASTGFPVVTWSDIVNGRRRFVTTYHHAPDGYYSAFRGERSSSKEQRPEIIAVLEKLFGSPKTPWVRCPAGPSWGMNQDNEPTNPPTVEVSTNSITVEEEPADLSSRNLERCCFCRQPTRFWYRPNDVACCPTGASRAIAADVPNKETWIRRELIADPGE